MKNNDDPSSDLEVGMTVGGTAAIDSPSRPENPSTTGSLAPPADDVDKRKELKSVLSRSFQSFNLTRTTTQQKVLVLLCVAGAILDPLFFYIPMINVGSKCMKSDRKLGVVAISLRSLVDVLHFVLWLFYYEKKWKAGTSNFSDSTTAATTALKKNSQGNPNSFSPRNSKVTDLLIEILCILPLPQATTLAILIIKGGPRSQQVLTLLKLSVLSQFVLHIFRVFPSFQEATTNSFTLLKSRFWIGAGFNLLLFVIASHMSYGMSSIFTRSENIRSRLMVNWITVMQVLGAFWYLLSAGRLMDYWKNACRRSQVGCNIESLYCGSTKDNNSYLDVYCPIQPATNSSAFDFGIYRSALESNILGLTRFPLKLGYCFWWGLQKLSSLGQNLTASTYEWEILFSICISILGLILFSLFIGNMQTFFQYRTNEDLVNMKGKMGMIEKKQRELLKWEPFRWLPEALQSDIIFCTNDSWLVTTEVNLLTTLNYLPNDLGKRIKESIFSKLEKKVRLFRDLNTQVPDMFYCMKPEVFAKGKLVFEKDKPIDKMLFILHGKLTKQTRTDGSTPQKPQVWNFVGEELLKDIVKWFVDD